MERLRAAAVGAGAALSTAAWLRGQRWRTLLDGAPSAAGPVPGRS